MSRLDRKIREVAEATGMQFDPWGLGYSRQGSTLSVHYPKKVDGVVHYAAGGFTFDHHPEMRRSPASERSILWGQLLEGTV